MISLNSRKLSFALTTLAVIGMVVSQPAEASYLYRTIDGSANKIDSPEYHKANSQFVQKEAGSKIKTSASNLLLFNTDELSLVGTRRSENSPNLFIGGNVRANE